MLFCALRGVFGGSDVLFTFRVGIGRLALGFCGLWVVVGVFVFAVVVGFGDLCLMLCVRVLGVWCFSVLGCGFCCRLFECFTYAFRKLCGVRVFVYMFD